MVVGLDPDGLVRAVRFENCYSFHRPVVSYAPIPVRSASEAASQKPWLANFGNSG